MPLNPGPAHGVQIIWSDGAVADLEDICKYIAWRNAEAAGGLRREYSTISRFWGLSP